MADNNSPFRVLLVDDRKENLQALETILEGENYDLVRAMSGKEALSHLLKDQDFHLIIMDVFMPVMNGFETAEVIYSREKLNNIPIIFLTAMDIEGNIFEGYKAGAIDYISKPVIPELLKVKVRAFVDLSEKTRRLLRQEEHLRTTNQKLEQEITERKLSEERVKALNENLARKLEEVQALDSFNYSVSHDLMSPLNSIMSLATLLQNLPNEKMSDDALVIVGHIVRSTEKMAQLIRDLLTFSRQSNAKINKAEFNMSNLVQEVLQDITLVTPILHTDIILQELPHAHCDTSMMKQVWTNLISNALKYSQKTDHPRIEIGSRLENGKRIYFVKDNGVGFDMKNYNKLFGVFQRLHSDNDFNGTGIGLAIVKRIIDRHDGKIWAESTPGQGASFYFTLGVPTSTFSEATFSQETEST